jgi:NADPH-dependent glutamate synthase beta subunit-like oxidoreductase
MATVAKVRWFSRFIKTTILTGLIESSARTTAIQKLQPTSEVVNNIRVFSWFRNSHNNTDPREYCISTKDFVVDDDGKLQGLNTGNCQLFRAIGC